MSRKITEAEANDLVSVTKRLAGELALTEEEYTQIMFLYGRVAQREEEVQENRE